MIPYPLRSTCLNLSINPFGFWWKPVFFHAKDLNEAAREDGETIWYVRFAWFQLSYNRWR